MTDISPSAERSASDQGSALFSASRRKVLIGGTLATGLVSGFPAAAASSAPALEVRHKRIRADGVDVFYREAGAENAPVILLLHGFANSSFYFRHLMPRLADRYRLP